VSTFSCCVDLIAAEHVPGDGLIHFGEACLSNLRLPKIPLLFIFPAKVDNKEKLKGVIQEEVEAHSNVLLVFSCNCSHLSSKNTFEYFCIYLKQFSGVIGNFEANKNVVVSKLITGEDRNFANVGSQGQCNPSCKLKIDGNNYIIYRSSILIKTI